MALLVVGCQAEPPMGVRETISKIHSMNGQRVRVAGYLGRCWGYDCALYENEDERKRADRYFMDPRLRNEPVPEFLGIGGEEKFDAKARPFTNSYVVISGKLSDRCRDKQLRWSCLDRGSELEPIAIERWTPAAHS